MTPGSGAGIAFLRDLLRAVAGDGPVASGALDLAVIADDTPLDALELDSLAMAELVFEISVRCGEPPERLVESWVTVGDVVAYLEPRLVP